LKKIFLFGGLSFLSFLLPLLALVLNLVFVCNGGITSTFVRKDEKGVNMSLDSDVFIVPSITQGDLVGKTAIVSCVTID
jgi:acid phosphatase type 7